MENRQVARSIFAIASLLESQGANPFRVRAYRRAAVNLLRMPESATAFVREAPAADAVAPFTYPAPAARMAEAVELAITRRRPGAT